MERLLQHPMLPTPPSLALRVVELASQPECDQKEISRILSRDPALCAQLLKTVNSPLFGISRPATSIERAVVVLGVKSLRSLVLGFSLAAMQRGLGAEPRLQHFLRESALGAIFARELAARQRGMSSPEEMVAGLLRDVGKLVLHQVMPQESTRLQESALLRPEVPVWELEREQFGFDHAELGAGLLQRWRLPADLILIVRHHHQPEKMPAEHSGLTQRVHLIQLADELAGLENLDRSRRLEPILRCAQDHFGMSASDLQSFLSDVTPKVQEFSALLQIDLGARPDYSSILARGCEELVRLSMEPPADHSSSCVDPEEPAEKVDQTVSVRRKASGSHQREAVKETKSGDITHADLCIPDPVALQLEGYEVREVIGRGAMGIVLKAYDPELSRLVAIKVLAPERAHNVEARKRFAREARMAAAIRHPHVVTIHAVKENHTPPFLVMEFVPGVSLQEHLDRHGALPLPQVVRLGRQIALGLSAAHQLKLIHRDIKPANILLDESGLEVKITDFGLARSVEDTQMSLDGQLIGTPLYMSPEQVRGERVDHRSDLFSLGSLLYTLSVGKPPFPGTTLAAVLHQVSEYHPLSLREINPALPACFSDLVARLQAKRAEDRVASAEEVAALLGEWERGW